MDDTNIINNINTLGNRIERSLDAQTTSIDKDFSRLNDSLGAINASIKENNEALKDTGEKLNNALTGIKEKIITHLIWFIVLVGTAMSALGLQVMDRWPLF